MWEDNLSEHQIRGWSAVSDAELHGQGSPKKNAFSQTPVSQASAGARSTPSPAHGPQVLGGAGRPSQERARGCHPTTILIMIVTIDGNMYNLPLYIVAQGRSGSYSVSG